MKAPIETAWREYHVLTVASFTAENRNEWTQKYLHGLLLDLPRKSIELMVLALDGANPNAVRSLQLFISAGAWVDDALLQRHGHEVDRELGEDDGVLLPDGSDFLKQGQESVGGHYRGRCPSSPHTAQAT
jgi:SRSO17 transposase